MKVAAEEHLAMDIVLASTHYPEFWDSPPYHNMPIISKGHFEGSANKGKFQRAGEFWSKKMKDKNEGVAPHAGGAFFSKFKSWQTCAYSLMRNETFLDNPSTHIDSLCFGCIENLLFPFDIHADGIVVTKDTMAVVKKTSGSVALKVIKTWLNCWATSRRMHEDSVLRCLLSWSEAQDDVLHYVTCPHMYTLRKNE